MCIHMYIYIYIEGQIHRSTNQYQTILDVFLLICLHVQVDVNTCTHVDIPLDRHQIIPFLSKTWER